MHLLRLLVQYYISFFKSFWDKPTKYYFAADFGGTTGRVAVFDSPASTVPLEVLEFPMSQKPKGVDVESEQSKRARFKQDMSSLSSTLEKLVGTYGRPHAMGVAVAGRVSSDRRRLLMAGNLTHWVGHPITEMMSSMIGFRKVILGNDAEAPAMAEALHNGSIKGRDFKFMIWGTGIGGSTLRIVGGKLVAFAGEPGHIRKSLNGGRRCNCNQGDCLESNIGGYGITQSFGVESAKDLTPAQWDNVVEDMALAIGNMASVELIEEFVFGGGLIHKQPWLLDAISEKLSSFNLMPRLSLSVFRESAGLVGALALTQMQS